jgi:hypothetical protein
MKLRNHPLMTYEGRLNWPPVWICTSGTQVQPLIGEVGILQDVKTDDRFSSKCFLYIKCNEATFMGCLRFDYSYFCHQVFELLKDHCGDTIEVIGGLDIDEAARRLRSGNEPFFDLIRTVMKGPG